MTSTRTLLLMDFHYGGRVVTHRGVGLACLLLQLGLLDDLALWLLRLRLQQLGLLDDLRLHQQGLLLATPRSSTGHGHLHLHLHGHRLLHAPRQQEGRRLLHAPRHRLLEGSWLLQSPTIATPRESIGSTMACSPTQTTCAPRGTAVLTRRSSGLRLGRHGPPWWSTRTSS